MCLFSCFTLAHSYRRYSKSGAEEKVHFMTYYMKPVQIVSSFRSFLSTVLSELNRLFETVFLLIGTLKLVKNVTHKRLRYLASKSNKVGNENT